MNRVKLLVILFGNPGGDGKTTMAASLEALSRACNLSVEVVCADAGNGAIRQILPSSSSVVWGQHPEIGQQIIAHYASIDVILIDCGANSSTGAYNILDLLKEARDEADKQGRACLTILPIGTNKPGASGMAKSSQTAFVQAGYQALTILNNRDGSHEYVGISKRDLPMFEFPNLAPGFMSVLNHGSGSWYNLLSKAPPGYSLAVDCIANWLERISALPPISEAFGIANGGLVFGRPRPLKLRRFVGRLQEATDEAILANHEYAKAFSALLSADLGSNELAALVKRFQETAR